MLLALTVIDVIVWIVVLLNRRKKIKMAVEEIKAGDEYTIKHLSAYFHVYTDTHFMGTFALVIVTLALLASVALGVDSLINIRTLPAKIEVYEDANKDIEQTLSLRLNSVSGKANESELSSLDNVVVQVMSSSELSSEQFVQEQVNEYMENKKEITSLKLQQVDSSTVKWLLYFGK